MTTWANIEAHTKRTVGSPIVADKQTANRASATAGGTYAALVDNSANDTAVVAYVLTENNCQLAVSEGSPANDNRSYVILANGKDAFVVPAGYKLWIRNLA